MADFSSVEYVKHESGVVRIVIDVDEARQRRRRKNAQQNDYDDKLDDREACLSSNGSIHEKLLANDSDPQTHGSLFKPSPNRRFFR